MDRQIGADAISAQAIALGIEQNVLISECLWDFGSDLSHEHAHRLDLLTTTTAVRLYFRELELTTDNNLSRTKRIRERLQRAISQLVPRTPQQTYGFR